jgi:hypothetical protein
MVLVIEFVISLYANSLQNNHAYLSQVKAIEKIKYFKIFSDLTPVGKSHFRSEKHHFFLWGRVFLPSKTPDFPLKSENIDLGLVRFCHTFTEKWL